MTLQGRVLYWHGKGRRGLYYVSADKIKKDYSLCLVRYFKSERMYLWPVNILGHQKLGEIYMWKLYLIHAESQILENILKSDNDINECLPPQWRAIFSYEQ